MIFNQQEFDIRLEWGMRGVEELARVSDVIIIVDVLSFSTCVDVATSKDAVVYPYKFRDETANEYAANLGAELAVKRTAPGVYSLSPQSLVHIKASTKLVLPSPNGSTLTLGTGSTPTICGCLRNAKAVAEKAMQIGSKIAIIPAGERWEDGSLRIATEDLLGAGAIIAYLQGSLSPESKTALFGYKASEQNIPTEVKQCISGKELIEMGFEADVDLACQVNVSTNVPILKDGYYVAYKH